MPGDVLITFFAFSKFSKEIFFPNLRGTIVVFSSSQLTGGFLIEPVESDKGKMKAKYSLYQFCSIFAAPRETIYLLAHK